MSGGLVFFVFVVGGSLYLLMNYPIVFWLVVVPLVLLFLRWLFKK